MFMMLKSMNLLEGLCVELRSFKSHVIFDPIFVGKSALRRWRSVSTKSPSL